MKKNRVEATRYGCICGAAGRVFIWSLKMSKSLIIVLNSIDSEEIE